MAFDLKAVINSCQVPFSSNRITGAKSTVFFVNDNGFVTVQEAQDDPEITPDVGAVAYKPDVLFVRQQDGSTARMRSASKDLAALGYNWNGVNSARLYIAGELGPGLQSTLQEICKDGTTDTWFMGNLTNLNLPCAANSPITAHINFPSAQLKVYYYPPNSSRLSVAWTTLGDDNWKNKDNIVA